MRVGVFTVLLADRSLEDALDYVKEVGCEAVRSGPEATLETPTANRRNYSETTELWTSSGGL
jgi:hypothetical protein